MDDLLHLLQSQETELHHPTVQRGQDGTAHTATLRSSAWQLDDDCWRLRYHQDTPTD